MQALISILSRVGKKLQLSGQYANYKHVANAIIINSWACLCSVLQCFAKFISLKHSKN